MFSEKKEKKRKFEPEKKKRFEFTLAYLIRLHREIF